MFIGEKNEDLVKEIKGVAREGRGDPSEQEVRLYVSSLA